MIYKKKANQAKKKQKTVSLKEIKLRPGTEAHDYNFKIKNAKKFITKGDKVKFTVKFKGREMQHTELGKELMQRIIEETKDIAKIESQPKFDCGNNCTESEHQTNRRTTAIISQLSTLGVQSYDNPPEKVDSKR